MFLRFWFFAGAGFKQNSADHFKAFFLILLVRLFVQMICRFSSVMNYFLIYHWCQYCLILTLQQ